MVVLTLGPAMGAGAVWYVYPQAGPWPLAAVLLPWILRPAQAARLLRSPFTPPLLLFVVTAALSVWAAYDRDTALAKFWPIIGGILLFYAFAGGLRESGTPRLYGRLTAIFGGGLTLYFLATNPWDVFPAKYPALVRLGQAIQEPLPAFNLHQMNPNVVGGILAMLVPFAGAVFFDAWQRGRAGRGVVSVGPVRAFPAGTASLVVCGVCGCRSVDCTCVRGAGACGH
jgi:hypothetical protein